MEQIILKLIDKLPTSFLMIGCCLYTIYRFCLSNKNLLNMFIRHQDDNFKKLTEKVEENKKQINKIKEIVNKNTNSIQELKNENHIQNEFLNILLNNNKNEKKN